ncbi:MAG: hypothetical protein K1060chlam5_00985 [Candidatus Anoxychlamydiales bacterium]|nr:hypothetical protein [Candidatus Anoxychlamydiales bacterium]
MLKKRIFAIILVILGVASLVVSFYIKGEVRKGRGEIKSAQEKVDMGKKLFSINPYTKEVGKGLTSGIERKIKEGKVKADTYEAISNWLLAGGIIFIFIGGALIIIRKKSK